MQSVRAASWLAWSLCALCVALLGAGGVLSSLNGPYSDVGTWGTSNIIVILPVVILTFALVGALIASRLPTNPIGWICLIIGVTLTLSAVGGEYDIYALQARPGSLPAGVYVAWLENWSWVPAVVSIGTFLVLLFPNGRLPTRRWRLVMWLCVGVLIMASASEAFSPGRLAEAPNVVNPLGIVYAKDALELANSASFLLLPLCFLLSALSMIVRFRRSSGEVRQQIKWFATAAALLAIVFSFSFVVSSGLLEDLATLLFAGLPVAVGVAILRHRLYDIDLVINRALVYGSLSATLLALYLGGVAITQTIFRTLTGQEQQPQLAIVASTLVIAALFNPLRRRIQAFIDRRFYRRKYDARKTLEDFSARLRDETDLQALNSELTRVVRETMQPVHVSVWLRPDVGPKDGPAN